jgi:ABC-type branched-subunit amino acid transport system substrate-binding protein
MLVVGVIAAACGNSDDTATEDTQADDTSGSDGTGGGPSTTADLTQFVPLDEEGVTDDEIRVSGIASATNPLGGNYGDAFDGTEAYFAMVNDGGGIYGRDLTFVEGHDDQLSKNQQEAQAILAQDNVFAVLPVATLVFTGAADLADAGVPTFGWNINPEWQGPLNLFGEKGSSLCLTCATPWRTWITTQLGFDKVGILAYGVSDQSKGCAEGARAGFEKYGDVDVAFYDDTLPFGVPDLSGEVRDMKREGVQFIWTCMDQNGVVTLQKEVERQGLDAVQYLSNAYDQRFVSEFGDLFEGSYVGIQFWPFENTTDQPQGMTDYLHWMDETGGAVNEISMAGWLAADLFVEGLKRAGPEFSRQKVIDALNNDTIWTGQGLTPGFEWPRSHTEEMPQSCFAVVKLEGGEFVTALGEPGKPFACIPSNADTLPTDDQVEIRS